MPATFLYLVPDKATQDELAKLGCHARAKRDWGSKTERQIEYGGLHVTVGMGGGHSLNQLPQRAAESTPKQWFRHMHTSKGGASFSGVVLPNQLKGLPIKKLRKNNFHLHFYRNGKRVNATAASNVLQKANWGFILSRRKSPLKFRFDWDTFCPLGGGRVAAEAHARKEDHKRPREDARKWTVAKRRNCWDGHGGQNVNLKDDNSTPKIMSIDEARKLCDDSDLAGFTYEPKKQRMWRLLRIHNPKDFAESKQFEVHSRV